MGQKRTRSFEKEFEPNAEKGKEEFQLFNKGTQPRSQPPLHPGEDVSNNNWTKNNFHNQNTLNNLNSSQSQGFSRVNDTETSDINRLMDDYSSQRKNRYLESAKGPFVVQIFNANPENNLGNMHIVSIGLRIYKAGFKVSALRKIGIEKISLTFYSASEANDFVKNDINLINKEWKAFILLEGIFNIGCSSRSI